MMKIKKLCIALSIAALFATGCAKVQERFSRVSDGIKSRTTKREKPVTLYSFKIVNKDLKRPDNTKISNAPTVLKVIKRGNETWVAKQDNSTYYAAGRKLKCNTTTRKCSTEAKTTAGWHFDWDNIGGAILWKYRTDSNPWEMYTKID